MGAPPSQTGDPEVEPLVRSAGSVVGWILNLYSAAGEAGGTFRSARSAPVVRVPGLPAADPERAAAEAARRAVASVRRYCASNRLNRLGTLTYAGDGNHDPALLVDHVGEFFRSLRRNLGGDALPYLWVPEWHPGGHGLHVHFAVGRYVPKAKIAAAWPHGFVHIKLIGDLPVGSGTLGEARQAARYLSKYVAKTFGDDKRILGRHRYEVAQGFQPQRVQLYGRSEAEVVARASEVMGAEPAVWWSSSKVEHWDRGPAVWVQWPG